jgi:two-component system copper resistance phosphate regulon response regulator CusR
MRILIVEDEQKIADFIKKGLRAEYFVVDHAADGERGSYLARLNEYDLIILDNMLPKKTGLEVCKEIREHGKIVPILVLSVKTETSHKVDLLNAGADDYLMKPFSFEELLARVRALLRRPGTIDDDSFTIGSLHLDVKRHIVRRGDVDIYLTRKEFMLLHYLMRNKGTVLSRGMIMEHVWDMNADPFSNTIESHVLSLRKKINIDGEPKLITTISGRGYKIE